MDEHIARYEEMSKLNNSQVKNKIREMEEESEMLRQKILEGNQEVEQVQEEFGFIHKEVEKMVGKFEEAHF